ATDAALTPGQARRLAIMAQAGLARAIRPVWTPFDGDVVFALATGRRPLASPVDFTLARLGALAADALARAVARGVYEATPWPGTDVRCWRDPPP
ncbi:MAG: P1 family peptidase, partial [Caulobacteraceae bacterium]